MTPSNKRENSTAVDAQNLSGARRDCSSSHTPARETKREAGETLPGEGEVTRVVKIRYRQPCEYCGENADEKHTYLLPRTRSNPKSSGYGKDDVSRCQDYEMFTCKACRDEKFKGREPFVEGYEWCGTYMNPEKQPHIFLRTREKPDTQHPLLVKLVQDAQAILAAYLPPDGISREQTINELLGLLDGPQAREALESSSR